ncbi:MAG: AAA family ATPase, partial [Candidatus Woesearchaeota archaeon]|nr:AAA family ATPase [Candidatus Woesearchaeota archaeon]
RKYDNKPIPGDLVCLNNFANQDKPFIVKLPKGYAQRLQKDIEKLILAVGDIPQQITKEFNTAIIRGITRQKKIHGLPEVNVAITSPEKYEYTSRKPFITDNDKAKYSAAVQSLDARIKTIFQRKTKGKTWRDFLEQEITTHMQKHLTKLQQKYADIQQLKPYLSLFAERLLGQQTTKKQAFDITEFMVNILVDNSAQRSAPIVFAERPSYENVVGEAHKRQSFTKTKTEKHPFLKVKAGTLLKADGGYPVIDLDDILAEQHPEGTLTAIKTALRTGKIEIDSADYQLFAEPIDVGKIDVNVKLILTGSSESYEFLCEYDPDFKTWLTEKAEFDQVIENTAKTRRKYAAYFTTFVS